MSNKKNTPKTDRPTTPNGQQARPDWLEALANDTGATATLRAGPIIFALYPERARPTSRAQAQAVRAELNATLDRLHYADLHALNEVARILANDHNGARWAVRNSNRDRAHYIERITRHASERKAKQAE